jgi:hypothetical protein
MRPFRVLGDARGMRRRIFTIVAKGAAAVLRRQHERSVADVARSRMILGRLVLFGVRDIVGRLALPVHLVKVREIVVGLMQMTPCRAVPARHDRVDDDRQLAARDAAVPARFLNMGFHAQSWREGPSWQPSSPSAYCLSVIEHDLSSDGVDRSRKGPFSRGSVGSVACTWRNCASRFSKTILDCNFLKCSVARRVSRRRKSRRSPAFPALDERDCSNGPLHATTVRRTPTGATSRLPSRRSSS